MLRNFLMSAVCLGFLGTSSALAVTNFVATLNGAQENPPVSTSASGTATLQLNNAQDLLTIDVQLFGLDLDGNQTPGDTSDDVTAFHIHNSPVGVNGGVVFGFISPNNDLNGDLVIDPVAGTVSSAWDAAEGNSTTLADQLAALLSNGLYFNVHTTGNGGGEIRGQIVPEPGTCLLMLLGSVGSLAMIRRR